MLVLTQEDCCALESIARGFSHQGEERDPLCILLDGFSRYGDPEMVAEYSTRREYFEKTSQKLLENIGDAGKTYQQACECLGLDAMLLRLVVSLGVPDARVKDTVQDLHLRALQYDWMGRYNPTISALSHWIFTMVRNYVRTEDSRESRKVTTGAVYLDGLGEEGRGGAAGALYVPDDNSGSPEERLDPKDVIQRFVNYLEAQQPFHVKLTRGFQYLCTLLPPGIAEIPTDREKTVFWIGGKTHNCRVTTWELHAEGISYKIPCSSFVDYYFRDPMTGEPIRSPETGELVCQRHYPNPDPDARGGVELQERNLKEVYLFLRDGWQIDEIGRWYRTPPTSVPAWVKRVEECFLDFLKVDQKISRKTKMLAGLTYQCPDCKRLSLYSRANCDCGCDMSQEIAKVRFDCYPWERVHVTRATQERLGNRRAPLVVQRGSLSGDL